MGHFKQEAMANASWLPLARVSGRKREPEKTRDKAQS